eukprot:185069-Chlamydomonas_euryale.AAC.3
MSPSSVLLHGLLSQERSDTGSMESCTGGCTEADCVPARYGCSGSSSDEHSSQQRCGSRSGNFGGSSSRLWQHAWQKILPHILRSAAGGRASTVRWAGRHLRQQGKRRNGGGRWKRHDSRKRSR